MVVENTTSVREDKIYEPDAASLQWANRQHGTEESLSFGLASTRVVGQRVVLVSVQPDPAVCRIEDNSGPGNNAIAGGSHRHAIGSCVSSKSYDSGDVALNSCHGRYDSCSSDVAMVQRRLCQARFAHLVDRELFERPHRPSVKFLISLQHSDTPIDRPPKCVPLSTRSSNSSESSMLPSPPKTSQSSELGPASPGRPG
jgi:hypothetical protein